MSNEDCRSNPESSDGNGNGFRNTDGNGNGLGNTDAPSRGRSRKNNSKFKLTPIISLILLIAAGIALFVLKPSLYTDSGGKLNNSGTETVTDTGAGTGAEERAEYPAYIASEGEDVGTYVFARAGNDDELTDGTEVGEEAGEAEECMQLTDLALPRGTEVTFLDRIVITGYDGKVLTHEAEAGGDNPEVRSEEAGIEYSLIRYDGREYYVLSDRLTSDYDAIVQETEKFVRTSVTVYDNASGPEIASFIKKGSELSVTGWSGLNDDGSVDMYRIRGTAADGSEAEGYVYSKYLADSQEEADAVNEEYYDIHKDREYSFELYGGSAATLDYFPCEKPSFEDNPLMEEAMSMYVTAGNLAYIDDFLALAEKSGVNTFVVDIKDGYVAMELETTREQCPSAYKAAIFTADEYKAGIRKILDAGYYCVGRIVVFNDSQYGGDHPETCLASSYLSSYWPSAYSRDAWYYNICMAIECVETFGFNEIQFDYVRFPEASYRMSQEEGCDFKNTYNEEKAEAIQNFLYYAADKVHKAGAYVSVDVFGECVGGYVTAYGQYWPAISNVVDAISGMPYVDHYGRTVNTWSDCYTTVYNWAVNARAGQDEIPTPAVARTWLTCYDVPHWNPTITCDADMMIKQIRALYDGGLTGGFMPWNGKSSLAKYYQISSCWSYDYSG